MNPFIVKDKMSLAKKRLSLVGLVDNNAEMVVTVPTGGLNKPASKVAMAR